MVPHSPFQYAVLFDLLVVDLSGSFLGEHNFDLEEAVADFGRIDVLSFLFERKYLEYAFLLGFGSQEDTEEVGSQERRSTLLIFV